jgi:hypothetical protein
MARGRGFTQRRKEVAHKEVSRKGRKGAAAQQTSYTTNDSRYIKTLIEGYASGAKKKLKADG